jgi:DNA-binding response OmpR family regulator
MSHRILLVEDELAFAIGVMDRLKTEGYAVELAETGPEGFRRASTEDFHLIVLDVMLPGKNGFDVCRDLRRASVNTPILMLTARGEVVDRVVGLKLGADDYVLKNCDVMELLARIEALLRRSAATAPVQPDRVEFGSVRIDFKTNEVRRDGHPVALSRAELRLLKYLVEHRGALVSREELLERVWGLDGSTLSRTVDVHMAALRKKLEPDPRYPQYILTVKGLGYRAVL